MKLIGQERPLGRHDYTYRPANMSINAINKHGNRAIHLRLSFERISLPLFDQCLAMDGPGNQALWSTLRDLQ